MAPASICLPKQQMSYISQSSLQGAPLSRGQTGGSKRPLPIVDAAAASPMVRPKIRPKLPIKAILNASLVQRQTLEIVSR